MAGLAKVTVNEQGSQPHTNACRQCSHAPSLAHKRACIACMHAPDTCTHPRARTQARSFAHTYPRALGRTIAFSNLLPRTLARLNAPTHAHAHTSIDETTMVAWAIGYSGGASVGRVAEVLADLDNHWELLAEPIQTVMRRYGMDAP